MATLLVSTGVASAQTAKTVRRSEPPVARVLVNAEGGLGLVMTERYKQDFDTGYHGIVRAGWALRDRIAVQGSVGNWWFPAKEGPVGRMYSLQLGARVEPWRTGSALGALVIDANAGVGRTGGLNRFVFDAGISWEVRPERWLGLGPTVRYQHIVQPDTEDVGDDGRYLLAGIGVTLRIPGKRDQAPPPPAPEPPADTDEDGIIDERDACPREAEDKDGFKDDDGCPEADNDGDGIVDARDKCPDRAEVRNGFQDDDGCPDQAPPPAPVIEKAAPEPKPLIIRLPEKANFHTGKARVRSRFRELLARTVCKRLRSHQGPIRVIGHADETGTASYNQRIAARRAGRVAELVVRHCQISAARIETRAYGATRRLCTDATDACRTRNRRVEIELVEEKRP
jgi:outer membrane protein OmpA-like peptidoglycan-associated protein